MLLGKKYCTYASAVLTLIFTLFGAADRAHINDVIYVQTFAQLNVNVGI